MTGGEKSLEELRPEKSMEVCRSSYRQTLFSDPIALHFLNLETSATRLARVLLVLHYILNTSQLYSIIFGVIVN